MKKIRKLFLPLTIVAVCAAVAAVYMFEPPYAAVEVEEEIKLK